MKKIVISVLLLVTGIYANVNPSVKFKTNKDKKDVKIMSYYLKHGFHSKTDVEKFRESFNRFMKANNLAKGTYTKIDDATYFNGSYMDKNNILHMDYTINTKSDVFYKACKKFHLSHQRCVKFMIKAFPITRVYSKCTLVMNKGFFKYGGGIEATAKIKGQKQSFTSIVKSNAECRALVGKMRKMLKEIKFKFKE